MNELEVIRLYRDEKWTLRRVAEHFNTNHHKVRRVLVRNGIPISAKQRIKPRSAAFRKMLSKRMKGRQIWLGKNLSESHCRSNMKAKLKTEIDLSVYSNFQKLKHLTRVLSKRKEFLGYDDAVRKAFLDTFYFDQRFDSIYDKWIASGKNKWYYPTLDHKTPLSRGGGWELENLHYMTWFENRAKAEMTLDEWEQFKQTTNTKSDLFWS